MILSDAEVLHIAQLDKDGATTNADDTALWSSNLGGILVREGDAAGYAPGVPLGQFGRQLAANDSGDVCFTCGLVGESAAQNAGLLSGIPSPVPDLLAKRGVPAPTAGTGAAQFDLFLDDHVLNSVGEVAFTARLAGAKAARCLAPARHRRGWEPGGGSTTKCLSLYAPRHPK